MDFNFEYCFFLKDFRLKLLSWLINFICCKFLNSLMSFHLIFLLKNIIWMILKFIICESHMFSNGILKTNIDKHCELKNPKKIINFKSIELLNKKISTISKLLNLNVYKLNIWNFWLVCVDRDVEISANGAKK